MTEKGGTRGFRHRTLGKAWALVESEVADRPSTELLFNPYADRDDRLDREDALRIRRGNLRAYFEAYPRRPAIFLLAEAPGPWGCRFSGVPITSEAQLLDPDHPLSGAQSSRSPQPLAEYSASIFWRILAPYFPHFFVWNSVPFHPHRAGDPLTIRTPRQAELKQFDAVTAGLVEILKPSRVLAIGRKAESVLARIGVPAQYVRHPSQGGAVLFEAGVRAALKEAGIDAVR